MISTVGSSIDLSALRISQSYLDQGGSSEKVITTVPIRKPERQVFVQVHPNPAYKFQTYLLEVREDNSPQSSTYLVDPKMWELVHNLVVPKVLLTSITRQGVLFLWPIKLPGPDGRSDRWSESVLVAAKHAETNWVRVSANMGLGGYDVFKATAPDLPEPKWPEIEMDQIINLAFHDRYIDSTSHDVIRKLRGEI